MYSRFPVQYAELLCLICEPVGRRAQYVRYTPRSIAFAYSTWVPITCLVASSTAVPVAAHACRAPAGRCVAAQGMGLLVGAQLLLATPGAFAASMKPHILHVIVDE